MLSVANNKTKIGIGIIAAAILSATPFIVDLEDEKLSSYQDVVGVWTVCSGETFGVDKGVNLSKEECRTLTQSRIGMFMLEITPLIQVPLTVDTLAAHTSFAYNIGVDGYRRSTTLRLTNQGNLRGGCNAMGLWNKADGRVVQGLINRRSKEIALCLKGIR
jgi:lysozyme